MKNIALVGIGPHAKRIYLNYLKKHKINLSLVVELESQIERTKLYLKNSGFNNINFFSISDKYKDVERLPKEVEMNLSNICKILEITHIIIATEPKAHNMYIEFSLKNNIDVLSDKPITVNTNMTNLKSIKKTRKQYYKLVELSKKSNAKCNIMCQRQYHRGYEYVKKILNDVVKKYQVPITYIDIYHCDGNWEMPHDLNKENHPYKYGYGKLFHSGYHFIDLLSDFIKINNHLSNNKKIEKGEIYSNIFTPNDEIGVFNIDDYKRVFKNQEIPEYYLINENPNFDGYGEKNFYGMMNFKNNNNQLITHAELNLLHYGFSRRAWINSRDYYKSNGRIRHERINIHVGTLLNIQIHSYQSKEIKDRNIDNFSEELVGGLEHFDIEIFRNSDLIGGKPHEKIKLGDLYTEKEKKDFLGYNELSREIYLTKFLSGKSQKGSLSDQALGIEILYSCALGIYNYYNNTENKREIIVKNKYINTITIEELKKYSDKKYLKYDKETINNYRVKREDYIYGLNVNYVQKEKLYEIYMFIAKENKIASNLMTYITKNKILAIIYINILKKLVDNGNIKIIYKLLKSKNKLQKRKRK